MTEKISLANGVYEIFTVFRSFNKLFLRPRIRSAVIRYQTRILQSVKVELTTLRTKEEVGFEASAAETMSKIRNLPLMAGNIVWANKIKHQLEYFEEQLNAILTSVSFNILLCGSYSNTFNAALSKCHI